jgi:hypothetical protein
MGCGVVAVLGLAVSVAAFLHLRNVVKGVRAAAESHDSLEERYGSVESYTPPAGGTVAAERMEVFLTVRESLAGVRRALEAELTAFPPPEVREKPDSFFKAITVIKSLGSLLNPIGEYLDARNRALLEAEMGLGEYVYIYSTAYYSLLGHAPDDCAVIQGGDRLFSGEGATYSPQRLQRRTRHYLQAMMKNQRDVLGSEPGGEENESWALALDAELSRLERAARRIPWEDGLPARMARGLEPFRDRLEESYDSTTNCLEFPAMNDGGDFRESE